MSTLNPLTPDEVPSEKEDNTFSAFLGWLITLATSVTAILIFIVPDFSEGTAELRAHSIHITQVERLMMTEYRSYPPEYEGFKPLSLPDNWDRTAPNFAGYAWYRFEFKTADMDHQQWGIMLPRVIMNAEVYLNGYRIGGQGRMIGDISRMWNRPLLFDLPIDRLRADGQPNVVHVQVAGYRNYRSGLGPMWVGSSDVLSDYYRRAMRWQVDASLISVILATVSGLIILASSMVFSNAPGLRFLGISALLWSFRNIGFFSDWTPWSHELWGQTVHACHIWFACVFGIFMLDYMGEPAKRMRRFLIAYALLFTLIIFGFSSDDILSFTFYMLAPVIPFMTWLSYRLLRFAFRRQSTEGVLMALSIFIFLILSVRDLLVAIEVLPYSSTLIGYFSGLVLFSACSTLVLGRYRQMFEALQAANNSLNSKLKAREKELLDKFIEIRQIQTQRAKEQERRRIMQDIHDGVGSSLVSALNVAHARAMTQEELQSVLLECLDDLRFAIDSLDPVSDDLLAVLGNFRWRFGKRLEAAGLKLVWKVSDLQPLQGYNSRDIFEILKIIQEAFANALKHAKASTLTLEAFMADEQTIQIRISDNGVGFDMDTIAQGAGRGLGNMQTRAGKLNGEVIFGQADVTQGANDISPCKKGCQVTLSIPLSK